MEQFIINNLVVLLAGIGIISIITLYLALLPNKDYIYTPIQNPYAVGTSSVEHFKQMASYVKSNP